MTWEGRLKEAAYTPPSGGRLVFDFEDVSREQDKKTTVFTFPGRDGAYVQDLGLGGQRFPLRIFFWGSTYDTDAQAFYDALSETGGGVLEHPVYGRKEVVPVGTIRQRDDLKTAANQAIFEIIFWESIAGLSFPDSTTDATTALATGIDNYAAVAPVEFGDDLSVETSSESVGFSDKFTAGLGVAYSALRGIAGTSDADARQFDAAYDSITTNLSELIADPERLAQDTIAFIRIPAAALASLTAILTAYADIITALTGVSFVPSFDDQPENAFLGANLIATAAQIALLEATLEATYDARPEAIAAAQAALDSFAIVSNWADVSRDALGEIDTGETYQTSLNATSAAAARLISESFTLLQERIFTVQSPRTPLDLVAELYGELDNKLDFFINSNSLVGTELLEIPAGREIKFYE